MEKSSEEKLEKAIRLAHWKVNFPAATGMFVPWMLFISLSKLKYIPSIGWDGFKWFAPLFLLGFFLGWIIWAVQVPKWRLQAYLMVDDIDQLKKQAVESLIIWPDGSILEKTEIASKKTREKIKKIEQDKTSGLRTTL